MTSSMPASPKQLNGSADDLLINILFPDSETMNSLSHLAAIQADREIQHWGYGVQKRDDKWFAYEWERESELSIRTQLISAGFDQKWQAEQFLISLKAR